MLMRNADHTEQPILFSVVVKKPLLRFPFSLPVIMFSDNSDDDFNENSFYQRKYRLLLDKCEVIQQNNEMLVHRLLRMKKLLRRIRKQRLFLMDWLDKYHDDWRTTDYPLDIGLDGTNSYVDLLQHGFVERSPLITVDKSTPIPIAPSEMISGKRVKKKNRKRKEGRAEKDPNAPKRPANPFFQFCQEQRPIVLDHMIMSGKREPSKQDLTKQLAANWNVLSRKDKKIYYDKYMKSKEQYIANMEQYTMSKAKLVHEPSV